MSLTEKSSKVVVEQTPDGRWLAENIGRLVEAISPEYVQGKRWFGSKSRQLAGFQALDFALVSETPLLALVIMQINYAQGEPELYHLPVALRPIHEVPAELKKQPNPAALEITGPAGQAFWLYDAFAEDEFCKLFYQNIYDNREIKGQGVFHFEAVQNRLESREVTALKRISTEQSNTSVIYNNKLILKAFRKLSAGQNPDFEVPFFITTHTDFKYVPSVAGFVEYRAVDGQRYSVGAMQDFVPNDGDGYTYTLGELKDYYGAVLTFDGGLNPAQATQFSGDYLTLAKRLGQITGEMHNALASPTASDEPEFAPEPIDETTVRQWQIQITGLIKTVCDNIRAQLDKQPTEQRQQLETILAHQEDYLRLVNDLAALTKTQAYKTRYHGDYHLGQVLKTGPDFVILDFEGEPARSLAERRAKHSPLKDVAGMMRSFNYAAYAGLFEAQEKDNPKKQELEEWASQWETLVVRNFQDGYCEATGQHEGARFIPESNEVMQKALDVFLLEKAFYELNYEFNNRPTWVPIPLKGILRIIGQG